MIEYKIRFKSGDIAYYKADELEINPDEIINAFDKFFKDGVKGTLTLVDCIDDKLTIINANEIVSIGFSKIEEEE